jgi:hypothetical protein
MEGQMDTTYVVVESTQDQSRESIDAGTWERKNMRFLLTEEDFSNFT